MKTKEELFEHVSGLDPSAHTATMLERLHIKGAPPHIVNRGDDDDPEEFKPLDYPFDYAWEKSKEIKFKNNLETAEVNE